MKLYPNILRWEGVGNIEIYPKVLQEGVVNIEIYSKEL